MAARAIIVSLAIPPSRLPAGLHGANESAKLGRQGQTRAKKRIETDPS